MEAILAVALLPTPRGTRRLNRRQRTAQPLAKRWQRQRYPGAPAPFERDGRQRNSAGNVESKKQEKRRAGVVSVHEAARVDRYPLGNPRLCLGGPCPPRRTRHGRRRAERCRRPEPFFRYSPTVTL